MTQWQQYLFPGYLAIHKRVFLQLWGNKYPLIKSLYQWMLKLVFFIHLFEYKYLFMIAH